MRTLHRLLSPTVSPQRTCSFHLQTHLPKGSDGEGPQLIRRHEAALKLLLRKENHVRIGVFGALLLEEDNALEQEEELVGEPGIGELGHLAQREDVPRQRPLGVGVCRNIQDLN